MMRFPKKLKVIANLILIISFLSDRAGFLRIGGRLRVDPLEFLEHMPMYGMECAYVWNVVEMLK